MDGDGLGDVLVGARYEDSVATAAGAVYLVLGGASGSWRLDAAHHVLTGVTGGDQAGVAVASGGDVDGDALSDVLVGAYGESSVASYAGATYLLYGGF